MKWKSNEFAVTIILTVSLVLLTIGEIKFCKKYSSKIVENNVVGIIKKIKLSNYISDKLRIEDKGQCVLVVVNESLCANNCMLAYDFINEVNSNYVKVIFESKYVKQIPMLNKTYNATVQKGVDYYVDANGGFSEIHNFLGNPLLLYCKNGKIVASRYITSLNYESITKEFSKFVSANI